MTPKPVVYVVVDGMNVAALEQAVAGGRAPAFAFLKERSFYVRDSVAVFPTITPAATASLVTGATPAGHGIPGMCWYDRDAERFVNYGQSPRVSVVEGAAQIVEDILANLNQAHLSRGVETLHERLHRMGLTSASINFMVFRGPFVSRVRLNPIERFFFRKRLPESLSGPKEHYFADVLSGPADGCSRLPRRGLERRIQATDGWAACVTRGLLEKEAAHMILFYLHENDHRSHRDGPHNQVESLAEADRHLGYVLDTFGSWEETAAKVGFVVTSDHSQSPIANEDDHILDLGKILDGYEQVRPGRGTEPFGDADLAATGNGRVAFVYLNEGRRDRLVRPVSRDLLAAPGVDQVMWRADGGYVVASDRGVLRFWSGDGGALVDERDNKWDVRGDLGAVEGVIEGDRLRTPEYPLALWRVKEALDLDRVGDLVVTMRLTYEVRDIAGGHHKGGGDHASLHAQDSLVPFMSTLAHPPIRPTTIDVMPHIVDYFERAGRK